MHTEGVKLKGDVSMDSRELFGEQIEDTPEMPVEPVPETETVQLSEEPEYASEQIQDMVHQEAKKGSGGAVVAVVTLLFILVVGLCVYIAVSLSSMFPKNGQEDKTYEAQTEDPWEEILGEEYKGGDSGNNLSEEEYPNYAKEDFSGPYYEANVDCIDESVSYKVTREYRNVQDATNNIDIHTSYIQLDGDIPGVEEINRLLKESAVYFADNYEENKEDILEALEGTGTGVQADIRSYVTYNTESVISVVIQENISMGYMYGEVAIRCYNINLDTGMVLDNASILDLEGFGAQFRERSNAQNGVSESGMEAFTDYEIESMLKDNDSLIIYYTPLGMEVGYNYQKDGIIGWITITMQDYEDYLRRM